MKKTFIFSQIKTLETQLSVLKERVKKIEKETEKDSPFSSLYGVLKGKSDTPYEEIKEVEYKIVENEN